LNKVYELGTGAGRSEIRNEWIADLQKKQSNSRGDEKTKARLKPVPRLSLEEKLPIWDITISYAGNRIKQLLQEVAEMQKDLDRITVKLANARELINRKNPQTLKRPAGL